MVLFCFEILMSCNEFLLDFFGVFFNYSGSLGSREW